ncbi:MAG TPA: trehalose-phosphatase [Acidimicrobiales bacterium]|nr:trehalose-phosphatase [Acidimicrobiales bacterium]
MTGLPAALVPLADHPTRSALFLDFDGTLAPIVDDPAGAAPLPGVPDLLVALGRRFGLVAVVSGRPVGFLADNLRRPGGVHLAGLYGMEQIGPDGRSAGAGPAEPWRPVVADVTRRALAEAPPGAEVEPKGLTVTLHWRRRPDAEGWATRFARREGAATGLLAQPGRMSVELRPPVDADKGTVVRRLAAGWAAAACFGDDLGDLPAFRALGDLAATGVAVARVAVVDADSPPEVVAAADVVVDGPAGAEALLRQLLDGAAER